MCNLRSPCSCFLTYKIGIPLLSNNLISSFNSARFNFFFLSFSSRTYFSNIIPAGKTEVSRSRTAQGDSSPPWGSLKPQSQGLFQQFEKHWMGRPPKPPPGQNVCLWVLESANSLTTAPKCSLLNPPPTSWHSLSVSSPRSTRMQHLPPRCQSHALSGTLQETG